MEQIEFLDLLIVMNSNRSIQISIFFEKENINTYLDFHNTLHS